MKRKVNIVLYAMPIQRFFSDDLIRWYKKNARDLPWRRTRDPYKIWVSEIMLQQTTVNAVIPYYERWIKQFPTIQTLAKSRLQKILKLWQGLGYYQRAKNIHQSAKILCREYDGKIPDRPEILKTLPGLGPYTVGAVLSIAFNKRFSIIDANVRRVGMRLLAFEGEAGLQWDLKISNFLNRVMPQKECGTFNQALMELGALVCRNHQPLCSCCPLENYCLAYKKGIQELIPATKKSVFVPLEAVVAVIEKDGRYLIQKRPSKGLLADLWEFPGGKIENGETAEAALSRELKEELGCQLASCKFFMRVRHFYTRFRVNLHVYRCRLKSYPPAGKMLRWVTPRDFKMFPMPSGSAKIVAAILVDPSPK